MAEKLRIHELAKELNVNSKAILTKCQAEGIVVKNHMSTVLAGLAATIREWFSEEVTGAVIESAARVDLETVRRKKPAPRTRKKKETADKPVEVATVRIAPTKVATLAKAEAIQESAVAVVEAPSEAEVADETAAPVLIPPTEEPEGEQEPAPSEEEPKIAAEALPVAEPVKEEEEPEPIVPVGPQHVPTPVQLKGPRVIRVEAPEVIRLGPSGPRFRHTGLPRPGSTPDPVIPETEQPRRPRSRTQPAAPDATPAKKRRAPGRRVERGSDAGRQIREWRDRDLAERQERLRGATGRRAKRRASETHGAVEHKTITTAQVSEPIILKDFCSATGLSLAQLTPKFVNELKIFPNINMAIEREVAELLAAEHAIELTVVAAKSPLADIREEFVQRERPALSPRAPVVTFLGHVDHGKTSLLDAIRHSRVAAGEAGGITQHLGSYHLEKDGKAVTFLDTPGHEAFTAMRARGAQLTDVVVLVVAADDGVMPQTVEAINHARAADVPIVVALNKIDVPGVDLNKIYGQLAEHDLAPTEWGGSTDVIKTSATEGTGIDELVEHLATLSELLELKADPTLRACGRVIEARLKPSVGPTARVLIQDGTLRKGDFIVCGPAFGKVRSLSDDQGRVLEEAGPSIPVEIAGLSVVPSAGDELFAVESLKRAEHIAEEAKAQRRRDSLSKIDKPKTLEDLLGRSGAGAVSELHVIVRADTQGSVDVLAKTLSEFPSDEVKLNLLHMGVGGVIESDVLLAEASGAIIIGFHVVPEHSVRRLADQKGVEIRTYRVIYHLIDDIKKALEGLLTPEEKIEQRGTAEVREIFNVSKIGTIAGCFVRDGSVMRTHKVRIIRDSVVVRDGANIHSLRRFKDDAKEVKTGFECGIKIDGFDDIKPGDIIESYEIVKIARTL
ncbi:MAG: translation initiation factor IF-2 [Planctomycetes bacterium]|nr:translation initiation factor IF-2 [Planctomycetota bacterium]